MTTRKPMIALTPNYNIDRMEPYMRPGYIRAIQHAGGIPVTLPLDNSQEDLEDIAREFDGFLFTGGPDVHPFFFGEQTQAHCGNVSPKRDTLEFALLKLVMKEKKPVLGICRGIQLLNISLGGDIYQDIPSQFRQEFPVAHTQPFGYEIPSHTVEVVPGTLLDRIVRQAPIPGAGAVAQDRGRECQPETGALALGPGVIQVNSMHHQAVRRLAPGLAAAGYAPEGLVEALEMPEYPGFFLGVQWHPEYLWEQDPVAEGIFREFVRHSRK
ncbi:MAG: gamma-glutamyl-gamma-aminobutyrate hydrolase family protein [Lachnospiraceae bacterium]|jgi:putative glutamine amidotransferase|nr:gamma-glutamyl-gamma-aminobutyrate hydrolase family protein [Lachnospiraceae bacterium]MCI8961230.1 gamma-glutamyl-gamma-aminobutyrate hydrolase family protein [Lachnospiraceae bacterium]